VLINSQGEYFSLFDLVLPDVGHTDITLGTGITLDVQNFGCCVNVPINYMDANNTALGVNQAADNLFDDCRVRRPSNCTNSPLGPPRPPTTSPPVTTTSRHKK